jgi:FkbM family methyltransferase
MLDLTETVVAPAKAELFGRLMSGSGPCVYVVGRNKYAQRVSRVVPVEGYVDDFTDEKMYLGKPVIRMAELPRDCLVVSCVVNARPLTAIDRLRAAGAWQMIDYCMLSRLAPTVFAPVDYCADGGQDIRENISRYEWVFNRLADETSKQHFAKVLQFRLTMDLEHMRGFSLTVDHQYFEDFVNLQTGDVFVDGGGYDGETSSRFAARNKHYRRIHYFEPAPAMMAVSKRTLAGLRDVRFVQKGLFSRNTRLAFDAEGGDASRLSATGHTHIDVVCLDEEVPEPVTFLKLDIEGAEHEAIQGAAGHIRSNTPQMAVCIYHDQRDFWRIPLRVLEINDAYRLYVRHYSEGVLETVMFFLPVNPPRWPAPSVAERRTHPCG